MYNSHPFATRCKPMNKQSELEINNLSRQIHFACIIIEPNMLLALVKTASKGRQIDITKMLMLIWGPERGADHHTGSGSVPTIISSGLH